MKNNGTTFRIGFEKRLLEVLGKRHECDEERNCGLFLGPQEGYSVLEYKQGKRLGEYSRRTFRTHRFTVTLRCLLCQTTIDIKFKYANSEKSDDWCVTSYNEKRLIGA